MREKKLFFRSSHFFLVSEHVASTPHTHTLSLRHDHAQTTKPNLRPKGKAQKGEAHTTHTDNMNEPTNESNKPKRTLAAA